MLLGELIEFIKWGYIRALSFEMSLPSYCEHVNLLLTPTQIDVTGVTGDST